MAKGRISWPILLIGMAITTVASLSIHVLMLQNFHVPYPSQLPREGWARLPDRIIACFASIYLYAALPSRFHARSLAWRAGILFLLTAAIHEALLRVPIMNIAVATRWTLYPFLDNLVKLLPLAVTAVLIAAAAHRLSGSWRKLAAALLVASFAFMIAGPLADWASAGLLDWTAAREGDTLYNPPYDWHVEVPAYLTFLEPVAGCLITGILVWARLGQSDGPRMLRLGAILFAIKGPIASCLVNIHYADSDAITAMLSCGQFTFEALALAALTSLTLLLACSPDQAATSY